MAVKLAKHYFVGSLTDKHYQKALKNFRLVQQYRKEHPSATKRESYEYFKKLPQKERLSKNTVLKYWERENEPVPSRFSDSEPIRKILRGAVTKVSSKDSDILNTILSVYLPEDKGFDCDLTFAKGDFYRTELSFPSKCYDKYPEQSPYAGASTVYDIYDICNPTSEGYVADHSLSSIIVDLPQTISDSKKGTASAFKDFSDLARSYYLMLCIADQKLRFASSDHAGGVLVVKVGDIIYKGKTIWLSQIVAELATGEHTDLSKNFCSKIFGKQNFDFELIDKFVHRYTVKETEETVPSDRSIKANDYFLVFRKRRNPIDTLYTFNPNKEENGITVAYTLRDTAIDKFNNIGVDGVEIRRMTPINTIRLKGVVGESVVKRIRSAFEGPLPVEVKLNGSYLIYFLNEGFVRLKSNERPIPLKDDGKKKYRPRKEIFQIKEHTLEILEKAGFLYVENNMNPNKLDTEVFILSNKAYMTHTETTDEFFHGSGRLFDSFDLSHALEGDGKVKFGYGVYVTSKYTSAAHYSGSNPEWTHHYVYKVKVPAKNESNYISFVQPVHERIIKEAAEKLGTQIPSKVIVNGKEFRKFLAKKLLTDIDSDKKLPKSILAIEGEKAASEFLLSIGVDFIEWPVNWKNPDAGSNRAILNDKAVEIISVDEVELDKKSKLINGSERKVR